MKKFSTILIMAVCMVSLIAQSSDNSENAQSNNSTQTTLNAEESNPMTVASSSS